MITIANANALHIPLPDRSVQCVVTSPPYYGLRDYGTAKWEGGSAECDHVANPSATKKFGNPDFNENRPSRDETKTAGYFKDICPRCGARRIDAQIGLESTPAAYVANIVAVMRECWRVLKDDGVLWLNLGDSYAGSPRGNTDIDNFTKPRELGGMGWTEEHAQRGFIDYKFDKLKASGLKPKDLCGIPWRVAFALQDDGWYLRDAIIWAKAWQDENMELDGSTMPGSQQDRCTSAYEFVFMLSKRQRYYWDGIAIKTKSGAWPRNVWRINTQNYSGAHFATFPPALIEQMILAGTSARGECLHCGKAWVRVVEVDRTQGNRRYRDWREIGWETDENGTAKDTGNPIQCTNPRAPSVNTIGWRQQCDCPPHEPIPQTVLDPFAGSGTTGAVAVKHGRRAVLLDLNTKYIDLQFERTNGVQITMPV